jgi:Carboxypeptidase regulatory-like domain/TonB-dependent Receptor Plug Domain
MNRLFQTTVRLMVLVAFVGTIPAQTWAQNAAGRIIGNITDATGASVPAADVTVTNDATQASQHAATDDSGHYQVPLLPIGTYTVTIEKEGFEKQVFDNQTLQINQSLRVDAQLAIGQRTESLEVHEQVATVETANTTIGETVTGPAVQQAPLNGRDVLDLALLQPGVTEKNPDITNTSAGKYSIAGGRTDSVTYLLDGGINNSLLDNGVVFDPNPDTIAEFRILESNYSAEYGRNAGGIISVVTKSGTNQWHGSAFDFVRNDAFNANTFFNKLSGLPRNILKRNQYGATLGGPITIPHLVHGKDRFFFFVGYQGQRLSQRQTSGVVTVFTPAEVNNGDFSADPGVVAFLKSHPFFQPDPVKAAAGIIDPTTFNPLAVKLITMGLMPMTATGTLDAAAPALDNKNELTMKFDLQMTDKDKLSATVGGLRNPTLDSLSTATNESTVANVAFANVPGYPVSGQTNDYFLNLAYTRTFSSNFINELRFLTQRTYTKQGTPATTLPGPAALGFSITPDSPSGPPLIEISNNALTTGFTYLGPSVLTNNTFGISDTVSWIRGRHFWKMGGGFSGYQNNEGFDFIVNGLFSFDGGLTGNGFADYLLGYPSNGYEQGPAAPSNIRTKSFYGFLQDEWRATTRLTLTLGLRYEYNSPKYDTEGRTFSVIPGLQSTVFPGAPEGLVFPGDQGAPRGVNFPDGRNFAPRFGFAWDPFGNGKTSVRGGFGMFYDILKAEDNFQFNGAPPFFSLAFLGPPSVPSTQSSVLTFFNDPFGSAGVPNTFPSQPVNHNLDFSAAGQLPFGSGLYFVDPHLKTPYTYHYNLSVQRELMRDTVLEVSYLGSSSHGLTALQDANPFVPGTTDRILNLGPGDSTCPDTTAGDQFLFGGCTFGSLLEFRNVTRASYNALVASLTKQIDKSPTFGSTYFTLGYTWSHEIDNVSGFRQRNSTVPSLQPNLLRASGDTDVRNRITFSGGWDLPFDNAWKSGPKKLTQGWSLFPIVTWRTGFPLDLLANLPDGLDAGSEGPSGVGDPLLVRANVVGPTNTFNPRVQQTFPGFALANNTPGNYYFNPTSFSNAQCGDANDMGTCTPGPTIFPSDAQVVATPSLATYGTVPRNFLRGPGRTNVDLAVSKTTALWQEKVKLELRFEFFNIFNHPEFDNPDTNITSPTFGQILSTGNPRIIQLAGRLTF